MSERIEIRVSDDLKKLISYASDKLEITITDLIINSLLKFLDDLKEIKKTDLLFKIKNMKKIDMIKNKIRRNNSMRYIVRNFYRNIFQLAQSYILNRGDVPHEVILNSINEITELYSEFPYEMKMELHEEIQNIEKLKDKETFRRRYCQYMDIMTKGEYSAPKKVHYNEDIEIIKRGKK